MTEEQRNRRAFVSHTYDDRSKAEELATALRACGVESWLDKWEIQPGDSLIQKIFEEGLRDCGVFLVLLSPASIKSSWVREELDVAMIRRIEGATRVIPVVLEPCEVPIALRSLQWLDTRDGLDDVAKRIADVIFGVRNVPPVAPPPSQLKFDVPGLSKLAARVAVHFSGSLDSRSGRPQAFQGQQIASALSMNPEEVNDAVEELEGRGLVELRHYIGTAPFKFGIAEPTYALALQLRQTPAINYDPEADIKLVANTVVSQKQVEGSKLAELTNLSAGRINAAVQYLEDYGLVKVLRVLGTGPFTFKQVEATGATRRFVANKE